MNNLLFYSPLNEMYYGKTDELFDPLENSLSNLMAFFAQHQKHLPESVEDMAKTVKRCISEDEVPESIKNRLKSFKKDIDEDNGSGIFDKIENAKNKIKHYINMVKIARTPVEYKNSNTDTFAILAHRLSRLDPNISFPEKKEIEQMAYKEYMNMDIKDILQLQLNISDFVYFKNEKFQNYYEELISDITKAIYNIFKINNIHFNVINSLSYNCFFLSTDYFSYLLDKGPMKEFINNASNEKAIENWVDKNRFNIVGSNQNTLYFKKYFKEPSYLFVTVGFILGLKHNAEMFASALLHEIGHSFGFRFLPQRWLNNPYLQEKFADAFVTKFGYGESFIGLIENLEKVQLTNSIREKFPKYANKKFTSMNLPPIIQISLILSDLMTYQDTKTMDYHPIPSIRKKEQLDHLMVELNNPRLSPNQQLQLRQNIRGLHKKLYNNKNEKNEMNNFIQRYGDAFENSATVKAMEEYTLSLLDARMVKRILDKIYDETMGKK